MHAEEQHKVSRKGQNSRKICNDKHINTGTHAHTHRHADTQTQTHTHTHRERER